MDDLVDNEEKNHQGKKQLQQSPEKKKKAALLLFQLKNPSGIEGVELLLRKTCRAERRKCFCMINGHEGPFLAQLLLLLYSRAAERVNLSKQRKLFNNIIQTIFSFWNFLTNLKGFLLDSHSFSLIVFDSRLQSSIVNDSH